MLAKGSTKYCLAGQPQTSPEKLCPKVPRNTEGEAMQEWVQEVLTVCAPSSLPQVAQHGAQAPLAAVVLHRGVRAAGDESKGR